MSSRYDSRMQNLIFFFFFFSLFLRDLEGEKNYENYRGKEVGTKCKIIGDKLHVTRFLSIKTAAIIVKLQITNREP